MRGQRPARPTPPTTGRSSSPTATARRCGCRTSAGSSTASRTTRSPPGTSDERVDRPRRPAPAGHQHRRGGRRGQGAPADLPGPAARLGEPQRPATTARESIRDSVNDVQFTLLLTICLVVLVIFLFLRNLSATVIPSLALPMSIVGTFAVMYLLGYSLDNLSLMALTLVGRLRGGRRHRDAGEHRPPHGDGQGAAARRRCDGSREIGFTILSMTLSLAAVFIPVLFMGGHRRPAVPRVRGDHRGGDPGLGLRLADAHADALQPLPAPAPRQQHHGRLYAASERGLRRRCSTPTTEPRRACCGTAGRPWRPRRSSSLATVVALRGRCPRASCPARTRARSSASPRPRRASPSRRWCEHQQALAAIVAAGPERRRLHVQHRRRRPQRGRQPGPHLHAAQAARRARARAPTR